MTVWQRLGWYALACRDAALTDKNDGMAATAQTKADVHKGSGLHLRVECKEADMASFGKADMDMDADMGMAAGHMQNSDPAREVEAPGSTLAQVAVQVKDAGVEDRVRVQDRLKVPARVQGALVLAPAQEEQPPGDRERLRSLPPVDSLLPCGDDLVRCRTLPPYSGPAAHSGTAPAKSRDARRDPRQICRS
mmetsp:Transcript_41155/g.98174  ORF Transcript_41155/g.98174 Transcript_41155/m.98174 type:complete len:192 (-) Transcript_41155:984-1559(-)